MSDIKGRDFKEIDSNHMGTAVGYIKPRESWSTKVKHKEDLRELLGCDVEVLAIYGRTRRFTVGEDSDGELIEIKLDNPKEWTWCESEYATIRILKVPALSKGKIEHACECEDMTHFRDDHGYKEGQRHQGHGYGEIFQLNHTEEVKTEYGKYIVCRDCAEVCHGEEEDT